MSKEAIQKAHTMAALLVLAVNETLKSVLTPEQLAAVDGLVRENGADIGIMIKHDGINVRASVGVLAAGSPEAFETPLLRFDGPIDAAIAERAAASVINRAKMN